MEVYIVGIETVESQKSQNHTCRNHREIVHNINNSVVGSIVKYSTIEEFGSSGSSHNLRRDVGYFSTLCPFTYWDVEVRIYSM